MKVFKGWFQPFKKMKLSTVWLLTLMIQKFQKRYKLLLISVTVWHIVCFKTLLMLISCISRVKYDTGGQWESTRSVHWETIQFIHFSFIILYISLLKPNCEWDQIAFPLKRSQIPLTVCKNDCLYINI